LQYFRIFFATHYLTFERFSLFSKSFILKKALILEQKGNKKAASFSEAALFLD